MIGKKRVRPLKTILFGQQLDAARAPWRIGLLNHLSFLSCRSLSAFISDPSVRCAPPMLTILKLPEQKVARMYQQQQQPGRCQPEQLQNRHRPCYESLR